MSQVEQVLAAKGWMEDVRKGLPMECWRTEKLLAYALSLGVEIRGANRPRLIARIRKKLAS